MLAGLDDADRNAAFESMSGESLAGMTTSMAGAHGNFLTAVRDRALSEGNGVGAGSSAGVAAFTDRMSFAGARETVASRVSNTISAFDPSAPVSRGAGGWVAAYAADQSLEGKRGTADVSSRLNGFAGGYGVQHGSMSLGAAAGYTRVDGDVTALQADYSSDLWHAAIYAGFDDGVWAADVTLSAYGGDLESRRGIQIGAFEGEATGATRAHGEAISASLSRRIHVSDNTMIALGAIGTASSAWIDRFTETGAGGLSLEASGLNRNWQSLQLSARGTQDYNFDGRPFRIYAGAGVMGTSGDLQATGDMRFTGAAAGFGAFSVESAEMPPLAGVADVGLQFAMRERVTLSAGYRGLFSERLRDNQFGLTLRANW